MRIESMLMCGFVIVTATAVSAQTKFSGSQTCAKPDPSYTVPVGDRANHVMSLTKDKCTWTKGEIAGVQFKEEIDTIVSDSSGATSRDRGYGVAVLANGDTAFLRFEGSTTIKDDAPMGGHGTWSFTGGTGKLKGVKGKGTYTGKYNQDGTSTFDVEGEYQMPAAARSK